MSAKEIWEKLSRIDVSDHVERKGGLSYLSWSWALSTLYDHYPEANFVFRDWGSDGSPAFIGDDGTASVECSLYIGEISRTMWLPVMDHRNNSVQNPDSRAISDCKMRCLTKCIALFGLGMYLYAGEDLPRQGSATPAAGGTPTGSPGNSEAEKVQPDTLAQPEEPPSTTGDLPVIDGVVNTYKVFSENATTQGELIQWWQANFQELQKLEAAQPTTYKAVLDVFSARKVSIQAQEKSNGK